jgi:hypothetical protein
MKCFAHRENDAIAICKCCAKGVCEGCAVQLDQGVACSLRCEAFANQTTEMIRAGVEARKLNTKAGGAFFQPAFLVVMGIAFALAPAIAGRSIRISDFTSVLGMLLVVFGIVLGGYQVAQSRRLRQGG